MKILITGANGLVGKSFLARYADQREVFAATRSEPSAGTWIQADLATDFDTSHFPTELDAIICLAQSNRYRDLPDGAADLIDVNVAGVVRILQYAAKINKPHVIVASTGDVYGRSKSEPFREDDPFFQNVGGVPGLYPLSRKIAEDYATSFAATYGLQLSITRFFHIYGAEMPSNALVYRLTENIRARNPIRMDGDDDGIFLNPTHVNDVADALHRMATENPKTERNPVEAYNVAARESLSLRQIVEIIAQHLNIAPNFDIQPPKPAVAAYITPSTDKLAAHYGAFDTVSFQEGVKLSISVG